MQHPRKEVSHSPSRSQLPFVLSLEKHSSIVKGIPSRHSCFPSSIFRRNISQHVQVLAALALAVIQAHLVENFPSEVQTQNSFAIVQFRQQFAFAALTSKFLFAGLSQADLLQNADQKLVHIVLEPTRCFNEFALARCGQLLPVFNKLQF